MAYIIRHCVRINDMYDENKLHILTLGFAGENQKPLKSFDILRVKNINTFTLPKCTLNFFSQSRVVSIKKSIFFSFLDPRYRLALILFRWCQTCYRLGSGIIENKL